MRNLFSIIIFVVSGALFLMVPAAVGAVPGTVHYQGFLTDGDGAPIECPVLGTDCPSGPVNITFRLYEVSDGVDDAFWSETHSGVSVVGGVFHVLLGSENGMGTYLQGKDKVFLSLDVNELGELLPRQKLVSSVYALEARNAEHAKEAENCLQLGGVEAGEFVTANTLNDTLDAQGLPTLGALSCANGEVAKYVDSAWTCAGDANTQLDEAAVDGMVANNGYLESEVDPLVGDLQVGKLCWSDGAVVVCDLEPPAADILTVLNCADGELAKWDGTAWGCSADKDSFAAHILSTLSCAEGEVVVWRESTSTWGCGSVDPGLSDGVAIASEQPGQWDTAFSWGDHGDANYLTAEGDPVFSASAASGIITADIGNWNTAFLWGDHADFGYVTSASFDASPASAITTEEVDKWNAALSTGHADQGYLTAESDPTFQGTPAAGITGGDVNNWDTAFDRGDHAAQGYLKTESDPTFQGTPAAGIASADVNNWNTAFNRGDHAAQGYLKSESDPQVGGLTGGKYCRASGGQVVCDQDPPTSAPVFANCSGGTLHAQIFKEGCGQCFTGEKVKQCWNGGIISVSESCQLSCGPCWVAREVVPEQWRDVRTWLMNQAPEGFFHAYLENGEAFAEYLRSNPWLKAPFVPAFEYWAGQGRNIQPADSRDVAQRRWKTSGLSCVNSGAPTCSGGVQP